MNKGNASLTDFKPLYALVRHWIINERLAGIFVER
jgi:hypothetical protein